MTSHPLTSALLLLLFMTQAWTCLAHSQAQRGGAPSVATSSSGASTESVAVQWKGDTRWHGRAVTNGHFSSETSNGGILPEHHILHSVARPPAPTTTRPADDGNVTQAQLAAGSSMAARHARHDDETFGGLDLTSLFASSSPGDLLDDAELDELINAEGMWTSEKLQQTDLNALKGFAARDGLVTRAMYHQFSKAIVYVAFPLIIVGFVTNVIAVKVFRRLSKNVTNTYMVILICFDMAYLLFVVSSHVVVVIIRAAWARSSARHFLQLYVVYKFFILCARQVIVMATAFMSLDRYFAIASTLRKHHVFVFRRPKLLILLAALLILTFNSHKLLKRQVKTEQFPGTNSSVYYLAYTPLYLDHHGLLDDLTIASSCLFQYCPLFAMLVANISLMTSLHKYSRRVSLAELTKNTLSTLTAIHGQPALRSPAQSRSSDLHDCEEHARLRSPSQSRRSGLCGCEGHTRLRSPTQSRRAELHDSKEHAKLRSPSQCRRSGLHDCEERVTLRSLSRRADHHNEERAKLKSLNQSRQFDLHDSEKHAKLRSPTLPKGAEVHNEERARPRSESQPRGADHHNSKECAKLKSPIQPTCYDLHSTEECGTTTRPRSPSPSRRADLHDSDEHASAVNPDLEIRGAKVDKQFYHLEKHKCVTVVAYSLLFFLLALPLALLPILKKVFADFNVFKSQHYLFLIYVRIFPLLDIISASTNFFVFFIKGGAFRAGVWKVVRCPSRNRQRPRDVFSLCPMAGMDSSGTADSQCNGKSEKRVSSEVARETIKLIDK